MQERNDPDFQHFNRTDEGSRAKFAPHHQTFQGRAMLVCPAHAVRINRMRPAGVDGYIPTLTVFTLEYATGLGITLNAEECRILGEQLIKEAEILEAAAAAAATAAIDKARGGK